MYKPLTQNIRVGCLVGYFDSRIIPATSHKLRSLWAGPYRVDKLAAPSLAEIKPVYYPGEMKLVSLDTLKLYRGEDVVRQNPEDLNPDRYVENGELTELPEIPLVTVERVDLETVNKAVNPEITPEINLELSLEVPEEMEDISCIHERIQAELLNQEKEDIARAEEILELPPAWNEVQDLIMDDVISPSMNSKPEKRKREEMD